MHVVSVAIEQGHPDLVALFQVEEHSVGAGAPVLVSPGVYPGHFLSVHRQHRFNRAVEA